MKNSLKLKRRKKVKKFSKRERIKEDKLVRKRARWSKEVDEKENALMGLKNEEEECSRILSLASGALIESIRKESIQKESIQEESI